ncbi:hypothetical protein ACIBG4_34050 [Nonomuraea sp. NPDC050383]|uniref:hypothetical protein n=1 Tax=Nonomuraea sp. NPDC050383 TaxID=3364362 RepID=UPI0037AC48D1
MSVSSRSYPRSSRSCPGFRAVAAATLSAGVIWIIAAPPPVLALTHALTPVPAGDEGGAAGEESAAAVAARTAERLGLTGPRGAGSPMVAPDLTATAAGVPVLPPGARNPSGLSDVSTMAAAPDLPGLPAAPARPVRTFDGVPVSGAPEPAVRRQHAHEAPDRAPSRRDAATHAEAPRTGASRVAEPGVTSLGDVGTLLPSLPLG